MNNHLRRTFLFFAVSACPCAQISRPLLFAAETNHSDLVSTFVLSNDGETPKAKNNPGAGASPNPKNEKQETVTVHGSRQQNRKTDLDTEKPFGTRHRLSCLHQHPPIR